MPLLATLLFCFRPIFAFFALLIFLNESQGISRFAQGSPDHEYAAPEFREWGMARECVVASFKFLVRISQKTPMNVVATTNKH
jgi:hypothetical protein